MRTLLLTSFSILGGLTTVHAQHWIPYSFYAFKQVPKETETPAVAAEPVFIDAASEEPIASAGELEAFFYLDGETAQTDSNSVYYSDPDRDYGKPKAPKSNTPKEKQPPRSRLCSENWWVEGDYLLAWMKKGHIDAPLITTGSAGDAVPGAIGQPGTTVVYGNQHYDYNRVSGVRGMIGGYGGTDRDLCFDIDGFWIFSNEKHFHQSSNSDGSPLIARPFINVATGLEDAELVSSPGLFSGSSKATVKTNLWGGEFNIGHHACDDESAAGSIFIGFRYLRLFEKITVQDESFALAGGNLSFNTLDVAAGETLLDEDTFRTNNHFYGGQLGLRGEFLVNKWISLSFFAKVAVGSTQEKYKTSGTTTWESGTVGDQYATGGVLVQPNNSVHESKWKFSWVPEAGVNFGIEPFGHMRFLVGYSFMWWSNVARPGEQMDRNVNPGQMPRSDTFYTPVMQSASTHIDQQSFWLQTLNFGVTFDF